MESTSQPVYFRSEDYAGFGRRIAAFLLDHAALLFLLIVFGMATMYPPPPDVGERVSAAKRAGNMAEAVRINNEYINSPPMRARMGGTFKLWFLCCAAYYVLPRRLRGGTVGYRLTGMRLVDIAGNPPRLGVLFKRLLLGAILAGPLGLSYLLCIKDPKRQALHDRLCNTWLVRKRAEPVSPATVLHRIMLVASWAIRYEDVGPPEVAPTNPTATTPEPAPA